MGTRSLTKVYDEDGNLLVNIYGQYDGYPTGHGEDLKKILGGRVVRNGFGMDDTLDNAFNGANCMAAAIVAGLKNSIGGFYLFPHDDAEEEYEYYITIKNDKVIMACVENGKILFSGPIDEFDGEDVEDEETGTMNMYSLEDITGD